MKSQHRLADLFRSASHQHARAYRRQHVLQIVRAFQRDLGDLHDLALLPFRVAEHDVAVADPRALLHFFLPAEPEHLRARPRSQGHAGGIVGIEHGEVGSLLIFEDARLCVHIDFESSMTVEMIGRDVQHDRNFRTESLNRFQLKARNLEHDNSLRLGALGQRDGGRPDVAAHQRRASLRQS